MKHSFNVSRDGGVQSLFTADRTLVCGGYERIVIGGRGPYVEIADVQLNGSSLVVPAEEKHRLGNDIFYYDEYRTTDDSYVKVYHQKKLVSYAEYKIGFYYVDPADLFLENGTPVLVRPTKVLSLFQD